MQQDGPTQAQKLEIILRKQEKFSPVLPQEVLNSPTLKLNMTESNPRLKDFDFNDINSFVDFINSSLKEAGASLGVGGYAENRVMYRHSKLFTPGSEEARSLHLAVDLWYAAGTPVFSPLDGVVHSFQDNNNLGDYGPTIILQHELEGTTFYTLYGHLSRQSLIGLTVGQKVSAGQQIATFGGYEENGQWPPHLHFQLITDMLGKSGDFPGVCKPSEQDYWLGLCPDANLILRLPSLN